MKSLTTAIQLLLLPYTLSLIVPSKTYSCENSKCQLNAPGTEGGISQGICLTTCGDGNIWPKPTGTVSISSEFLNFNFENIFFDKNTARGHPVVEQIQRNFIDTINQLVIRERGNRPPRATKASIAIQVNVEDTSILMADYLNDESYSLSVDAANGQVTISATTVFGARHGLETLSQLISYDYLNHALAIPSTVSIEKDGPVFPYRGVMIDVSRNFISLNKLKENVRAMGYNKMNVLHLHISDTASFPLSLNSQPNVTSYGAYDDTRYFSTADMEELVSFANAFGVMILPEIDTPAHVAAGWQWGAEAGLGDLAICTDPEGTGGSQWDTDSLEPPSGHLNIANENVYPILSDVYSEIITLFRSNYFHMGGDEVIVGSDESWAACWNSTTMGKDIINKVAELGLDRSDQASFYYLWAQFTMRATDLVKAGFSQVFASKLASQQLRKLHMWGGGGVDANGVTYNMMLQSDVTTTLPPELFTIQVWDTSKHSITPDLIDEGYDVILSNTDYVYLDCGNAGNVGPGGYWCQPYHEWYHIYQYIDDVRTSWKLTDEQMKHVKGSETLIWTEMVDDANLSQKVWPRSSALAEALWSDPTEGWYPAAGRFLQWRDRLVQRGVNAEAQTPYWCSQRDAYACYISGGTPQ